MSALNARPRALVITPTFFGYEKDIVAELERQGFQTTFIDERPSNSSLARALIRKRKQLLDRRIDRYYSAKQTELNGVRFDLVFVVRAEATPRWFLQHLRQTNPSARFVFYIWDAVSKATNCLDVLDCFDERFSFNPPDVAAYPTFSYLPLFYTRDFAPLPVSEAVRPRRFTLSYIGTLHPGRYPFVKKLFAGDARTFMFLYVQARWYFTVVKYLSREHRNVPWADVSFDKLSRQEVAEVFRESGAVLDMPQPGQSGLTIRTFEVLASGAVLVTTNETVIREPFFDPARIIVVPEKLTGLGLSHLRAQLDSIPPHRGAPKSFDQYSIESWVRRIVARRPCEATD